LISAIVDMKLCFAGGELHRGASKRTRTAVHPTVLVRAQALALVECAVLRPGFARRTQLSEVRAVYVTALTAGVFVLTTVVGARAQALVLVECAVLRPGFARRTQLSEVRAVYVTAFTAGVFALTTVVSARLVVGTVMVQRVGAFADLVAVRDAVTVAVWVLGISAEGSLL
jgi:hypothetical protein